MTIHAALAEHAFLVGMYIIIADVTAYTYIAHTPEGNVDLQEIVEIIAIISWRVFGNYWPQSA